MAKAKRGEDGKFVKADKVTEAPVEVKVSKIIYTDEQELSNNIRSRSAKMRVIEKL